jgi:hypothetical protein
VGPFKWLETVDPDHLTDRIDRAICLGNQETCPACWEPIRARHQARARIVTSDPQSDCSMIHASSAKEVHAIQEQIAYRRRKSRRKTCDEGNVTAQAARIAGMVINQGENGFLVICTLPLTRGERPWGESVACRAEYIADQIDLAVHTKGCRSVRFFGGWPNKSRKEKPRRKLRARADAGSSHLHALAARSRTYAEKGIRFWLSVTETGLALEVNPSLALLASPERNAALDAALDQLYVAPEVYQREAEYADAEQRRREQEHMSLERKRLQREEEASLKRWLDENARVEQWLEELEKELKLTPPERPIWVDQNSEQDPTGEGPPDEGRIEITTNSEWWRWAAPRPPLGFPRGPCKGANGEAP